MHTQVCMHAHTHAGCRELAAFLMQRIWRAFATHRAKKLKLRKRFVLKLQRKYRQQRDMRVARIQVHTRMYVRACVHACVHECVPECVRAFVRACPHVRLRVCLCRIFHTFPDFGGRPRCEGSWFWLTSIGNMPRPQRCSECCTDSRLAPLYTGSVASTSCTASVLRSCCSEGFVRSTLT